MAKLTLDCTRTTNSKAKLTCRWVQSWKYKYFPYGDCGKGQGSHYNLTYEEGDI